MVRLPRGHHLHHDVIPYESGRRSYRMLFGTTRNPVRPLLYHHQITRRAASFALLDVAKRVNCALRTMCGEQLSEEAIAADLEPNPVERCLGSLPKDAI
jgi:hypothetical protein